MAAGCKNSKVLRIIMGLLCRIRIATDSDRRWVVRFLSQDDDKFAKQIRLLRGAKKAESCAQEKDCFARNEIATEGMGGSRGL